MIQTLHPEILKLKAKAPAINLRSIAIDAKGKLVQTASDFDARIIKGYLVTWGTKNAFREIALKGCCTKSLQERGPDSNNNYKIKFMYNHDDGDPLSLFKVLREDDYGLYFETYPLDDVPSADRTIKQLRSGTLNNFSIGFDYIWDKMEYDATQDAIILQEIALYEGSVVSIPADEGTFVYRSKEQLAALHDDIEDFIDDIPRKYRLQARKLFAQQTSLINKMEPIEHRNTSLNSNEPAEQGIDYKFLSENFKIS